jgi:hypothetical protein
LQNESAIAGFAEAIEFPLVANQDFAAIAEKGAGIPDAVGGS